MLNKNQRTRKRRPRLTRSFMIVFKGIVKVWQGLLNSTSMFAYIKSGLHPIDSFSCFWNLKGNNLQPSKSKTQNKKYECQM